MTPLNPSSDDLMRIPFESDIVKLDFLRLEADFDEI